jgi:mycothiol S-conjugate amidase
MVHAHPDDESEFGGGTVARYHAAGVRTVLLCCTDGGLGRNQNPALGPVGGRTNIVEIRRAELAAAAAIVGFDEVVRLEYPDSGPVSQSGRDAASFARVPLAEAVRRVAEVIRREQPQVVVTYAEDQRAYPHPDHLRAHEVAVLAFAAAGDPAYPAAGTPWQPLKLYYTVTSAQARREINEQYAGLGLPAPFGLDPGLQGRGEPELAPDAGRVTTVIDVAPYVATWIAGIRAHACQLQPDMDVLLGIPAQAAARIFGREEFILARDLTGRADGPPGEPETDLFAGVA